MEHLPPDLLLRMWAITHFQILPTDPRIQNLSLDTMELLFTYKVASFSDTERMQLYRNRLREREDADTEKFEQMGYSGEELEEILAGIAQAKRER